MAESLPTKATGGVNPDVSVIIPARNEEASLGECLRSLVSQMGVKHEVIVVDDGSADSTREIAESFAGVQVIAAPALPPGWTGKNNAVTAGAAVARGEWMLFTDADTIHLPGSLARAVAEAKRERADLLSYSPEQIVVTLAERMVMPVVYAELAAQYPPAKVRDVNSGIVAANGQYILVRRAAYEDAGGHARVATEILEDVALAKAFRRAGFDVNFRYGGDAVRTRMYRNWAQLRDGWMKNLALLFPHATSRALLLLLWWVLAWLTLPVPAAAVALFVRMRRARFSFAATLLAAMFGPPVFAYLLLRSCGQYAKGTVSWKGRTYSRTRGGCAEGGRQQLRTDN